MKTLLTLLFCAATLTPALALAEDITLDNLVRAETDHMIRSNIEADLPIVGRTTVEVDQQPVHPTTLEVGGSLSVDRHWELLLEAGSNFDDAFVTVASAGYRF